MSDSPAVIPSWCIQVLLQQHTHQQAAEEPHAKHQTHPDCLWILPPSWTGREKPLVSAAFRTGADSARTAAYQRPAQNTVTHIYNYLTALSRTTQVGRYQKRHSPTHTQPDHRTSFINFLHLLWSTASSLFNLRAWQSFSTTSPQVLFGLPLGLVPSASYSIHFFTQSLSSFFATHADTIVACFAVVPMFFVKSSTRNLSLSAPYLEICSIP